MLKILEAHDPKELSNGEIRIQCPFRENHADGTGLASMFINTGINKYHCFSCGAKGLVTKLLTTRFDVSLVDALELVQFADFEDTLEPYEGEEESLELPIWELPHLLKTTPPRIFLRRGFSTELLQKFKIGYMNNEDGRKVYTIPLYQNGDLVGCKYRVDKPIRSFWYNDNFEKQKFIYNEPEGDTVILVEGETDVWRSISNGVENVASLLGTSLSKYQVKRLSKYEKIYLAFDNDDPGFLAAEKAYHKLKTVAEVLFVPYLAEDPGDCSEDAWKEGIANASDYAVYSFEMSTHLGDAYFDIKNLAKKQLGV